MTSTTVVRLASLTLTAVLAVAGSTAAQASVLAGSTRQAASAPRCAAQLAVMRKVGAQAGIRIGSTHLQAITDTGPRTWARELRSAGITDGSEQAALHIHSLASAQRFIAYLQQDAAGALLGRHCTR